MSTLTTTAIPWGPIGETVYRRTYSRTQPDGTAETWPDTVRRVAYGNADTEEEAREIEDRMLDFEFLPAGRHLWITGTGLPHSRNCFRCPWTGRLADHFEFMGGQLLIGGGVGANYSQEYLRLSPPLDPFGVSLHLTIAEDHPDYDAVRAVVPTEMWVDARTVIRYRTVADSREGWIDAWGRLVDTASPGGGGFIRLDLTEIRPQGSVIKTFGGTASGPAPLAQSLVGIARTLNEAAGRHLTPLEAMQCDHEIASAVVAGGARRSARMSILHWRDPAITAFIHCKADPSQHWTTNISVEVDEAFFAAFKRGDDHANKVYWAVIHGMHQNGEPGFYNVARAAIGERADVRSTNPCVTGDTWVLTTNGPQQVQDLLGVPVSLILDGQAHSTTSAGFFQTGVKPTVSVGVDGTHLSMTADHLVLTPTGYRKAGSLQPGDSVALSDQTGTSWGGRGSTDEGYLIGSLLGDGCFTPDGRGVLDVWDHDGCQASLMSRITVAVDSAGLPHRSDWRGWRQIPTQHKHRLVSASLGKLAASYGVVRGGKTITSHIVKASSAFQIGLIQALFDTDGHVEGSSIGNGTTVRLTQSDPVMLGAIRMMLLNLGIKSVVRSSHPAHPGRTMPGGTYPTRASWRLVIAGEQIDRFRNLIGFSHEGKMARLDTQIQSMTRGFYNKSFVGTVQSVTHGPTVPVYDCQVPGKNQFVANGVVVHNCGEVPLEDGESCNIGSVNLAAYGPGDDDDAEVSFRLMARFLLRATLNPATDPLTMQVEARNRRIGVGFLGLQEWALRHGVRYSEMPSSTTLTEKLIRFRRAVRDEADRYADELGIPRPIKVTAIAPNGTIAQLPGTQPGAHAIPFARYIRNVRFTSGDEGIQRAREAGYTVEPCVYAAHTEVVSFPTLDALVGRYGNLVESADELTVEEQLAVLTWVTEHYTGGSDGNAVSFTVSYDPSVYQDGGHHLGRTVERYLPALKGVTVFPATSRPQAPLIPLSPWQYEVETARVRGEVGDSNDGACVGAACPVR